jgi:hypothetical protein
MGRLAKGGFCGRSSDTTVNNSNTAVATLIATGTLRSAAIDPGQIAITGAASHDSMTSTYSCAY